MNTVTNVVIRYFARPCSVLDKVTKLQSVCRVVDNCATTLFKVLYDVFHHVSFAVIRGDETRYFLEGLFYYFDADCTH